MTVQITGGFLGFAFILLVFAPIAFPAVSGHLLSFLLETIPGMALVPTFLTPVVVARAILPPILPGLPSAIVGAFGIIIIAGGVGRAAHRERQN